MTILGGLASYLGEIPVAIMLSVDITPVPAQPSPKQLDAAHDVSDSKQEPDQHEPVLGCQAPLAHEAAARVEAQGDGRGGGAEHDAGDERDGAGIELVWHRPVVRREMGDGRWCGCRGRRVCEAC